MSPQKFEKLVRRNGAHTSETKEKLLWSFKFFSIFFIVVQVQLSPFFSPQLFPSPAIPTAHPLSYPTVKKYISKEPAYSVEPAVCSRKLHHVMRSSHGI